MTILIDILAEVKVIKLMMMMMVMETTDMT